MVIERHKPVGDWKDPKQHKPQLRRNFSYTCAYSWVHERPLGGAPTFEVEHLRPEGREEFKHLHSVYGNLYYVWGPCNRAKGKSWPSPEEAQQDFRFVDPCAESAFSHLAFEFENGRFTGRLSGCTPAGRYTITKCAINNDVLRDVRRRQMVDFVKVRKRLKRLEAVLSCESLGDADRRAIEAECADARALKLEILKPLPLPPDI